MWIVTGQLMLVTRGFRLVLVVIAALVVIATGFAFSMGVETRLVRNTRFNPDLDWLGRSGVELARYILSKPVPNEERMDALHQRWAGGPGRAPGAGAGTMRRTMGPPRTITVLKSAC